MIFLIMFYLDENHNWKGPFLKYIHFVLVERNTVHLEIKI